MMVGNSLRSDVLPAIAAGAHGVHVPHDLTWATRPPTTPEASPGSTGIEDPGRPAGADRGNRLSRRHILATIAYLVGAPAPTPK